MDRQLAATLSGTTVTALGSVAVTYGLLAGHTTTYRAGLVILIIGLAWTIDRRQRRANEAFLAEQRKLLAVAADERQEYAQRGWVAAKLDSGHPITGPQAQVVRLDARRAEAMRRHGSA